MPVVNLRLAEVSQGETDVILTPTCVWRPTEGARMIREGAAGERSRSYRKLHRALPKGEGRVRERERKESLLTCPPLRNGATSIDYAQLKRSVLDPDERYRYSSARVSMLADVYPQSRCRPPYDSLVRATLSYSLVGCPSAAEPSWCVGQTSADSTRTWAYENADACPSSPSRCVCCRPSFGHSFTFTHSSRCTGQRPAVTNAST